MDNYSRETHERPTYRVVVVLAVRDTPRVIGHQQQGVADSTHHIVGKLTVRKRLVTTFMGQDPDAGHHTALDVPGRKKQKCHHAVTHQSNNPQVKPKAQAPYSALSAISYTQLDGRACVHHNIKSSGPYQYTGHSSERAQYGNVLVCSM